MSEQTKPNNEVIDDTNRRANAGHLDRVFVLGIIAGNLIAAEIGFVVNAQSTSGRLWATAALIVTGVGAGLLWRWNRNRTLYEMYADDWYMINNNHNRHELDRLGIPRPLLKPRVPSRLEMFRKKVDERIARIPFPRM